MQTINFKMKEHEAEWKETRRQIKNDLNYEVNKAQRECADRIEKAQREYHKRIKEEAIEEDAYKAKATEARNAVRAQVLAELERIAELNAKHGLNGEGDEQ